MTSYEAIPGNKGVKQFKALGSGTETDPYVPVMSVKVDPDVTSVTDWSSPLLDANVASEKLVKETIDNQEVSSATFNTNSGVLTLTKTNGNIAVNLDGRYLTTITAIDADSVSLTNLEVDNFKQNAIATEAEGILTNDNDTSIPTSAAVKDYVDNTVIPDTNTYVTSASFNTANGVLTLTLNDSSTVTADLDGRFLQSIAQDSTPELGGDLDLNNQDIVGTGNINISGGITANLNDGNVFIGNATNQSETRGLSLNDIAETADKKIFSATEKTKLTGISAGAEANVNADWNATSGDAQILNKPTDLTDLSTHNVTELADVASAGSGSIITSEERTKLSGVEANATADQTKADIDALAINADKVDGLDANQFLRADTGDTINVGRGNIYIENNSNDNHDGAGVTIRTTNNPSTGDDTSGTAGSIWAVRSSGNALRFWVGQSVTSTGDNNLITNSATFKGNLTIQSGNDYYMTNNANVFHGINDTTKTPSSHTTTYYPVWDSTSNFMNTDIYSYVAPSSSANTGIQLKLAGKYKVSYTLNWQNHSYANRVNFLSKLAKHSSVITPTQTEFDSGRSFGYARDDSYATYATTTNVTVIDVSANEYIKCITNVSKNDTTFDDNFSGIRYHSHSSIVIEYLGNL